MSNTSELNLFFPINELSPVGWLNDFITPQLLRDKSSLAYSMIYRNYDFLNDETKSSIKKVLGENQINDYQMSNKRKYKNEQNFIFINGKYADILESNLSAKNLSLGSESDLKKYILFMNNLKPYQLAFLQPYTRLYYGWKDNPKDKNEKFKYIDFPFSQYFELENILENRSAFLEGSGIKDINVDTQFLIGTKRNSKLTIKYFFSNINVLTRELTPPSGFNPKYGFSFMKLLSHAGITKELVRLEYGYHIDPTLENQHNVPSEICNLINQREVKRYDILKTAHSISFTKEGSINLSVDYISLSEAYLDSENDVMIPSAKRLVNIPTLNDYVFKRSAASAKLLEELSNKKEKLSNVKEQIENLVLYQKKEPEPVNRSSGGGQDLIRLKNKKIELLKKQQIKLNTEINLLRRQMSPYFKNLFLEIIKSNYDLYSINFNSKKDDKQKIYSFNTVLNLVSPKDGKEIKICDLSSKQYSIDDFYRDSSRPESVIKNLENILNRMFNVPVNSVNTNNNENQILFFPLKALIRAAFQVLDDPDDDKRPYIPAFIFGNLTCRVFDKTYSLNIGNILVEVTEFQKWMHHRFFNKGFSEVSFGHFLTEIIDDLVPNAVYRNRTYPQSGTRITVQDYNPTFFLNLNALPLKETLEHETPSDENIDLLSNYVYRNYQKDESIPLIIYSKLNISTYKETTANNFSVSSNKQLNLNEQEDASRGIPHLIIGSDGGMFLEADFNQIDLKGLRSAVSIQSMKDDNANYFFYNYSISAKTIASSIFGFGSILCVPKPPFGLAQSSYDLGVAGYYRIKSVRETLDANGKYVATVQGDWFWNPRENKDGKPLTSESTVGKKLSEIFDYVPSDVYDPDKYIDLLIQTDINVVSNFGLKDNKKEPKKDKTERKKKPANKPKDEKEPKPPLASPQKSYIAEPLVSANPPPEQ